MSLRIKPHRVKRRRRGNRLIVENGDERTVYVSDGHGRLLATEHSAAGETSRVAKRSPRGQMLLLETTSGARGRMDLVIAGHLAEFAQHREHADEVGERAGDHARPPAVGRCQRQDQRLVADGVQRLRRRDVQRPLAVAGEAAVGADPEHPPRRVEIREALCHRLASRSAAMRGSHACATSTSGWIRAPTCPPVWGRRAENAVRHRHSNWDAMLRDAGGLLHVEPYETVRRGVDLLVNANSGTT